MNCFRQAGLLVLVLPILLLWASCTAVSGQSLNDAVEHYESTEPDPIQQLPAANTVPAPEVPETPVLSEVDQLRQQIVQLAESQIGVVDHFAGPDGFKNGWQNLLEYYQIAYKLNDIEIDQPTWVPGLKAPGKFLDGQNWSWCGIFCTWAWRKSGINIWWNFGNLQNMGKFRADYKNLGPGDIVPISRKYNKDDHICMVKSREGNKVITINGNQNNQGVALKTNYVHEFLGFYSVADMLPKRFPPPPSRPGTNTGKVAQGPADNGTGSGSSPAPTLDPEKVEALKGLFGELLRLLQAL